MNKTEFEKDLCERIISSMKHHGLEDCAYGVFMTGSFGRGEVTYEYDGDDVLLKSDVEIGVVYKNKKAALDMISAVMPEFEEELNPMTVSKRRLERLDNFNNAVVKKKYKTLFMYDLVNGNKNIWGVDFLKDSDIPLESVDLYEAKRIVANRIGEMVYRCDSPEDVKRWKAKLVAAIGTAYLLCNGRYKCSYHEQLDVVNELSAEIDSNIGEGFTAIYNESFMFLRKGAESFDITREQLRAYVREANKMFRKHGLTKSSVNTLSRRIKYGVKCVLKARSLNFYHIERRIIDALIDEYIDDNPSLPITAKNWFVIIY